MNAGDLRIAGEPQILPLKLHGVRFEVRGRTLLDGIDLELQAGPVSVILGHNGAGKSLLLRICHGLLQPTGGRVEWAVETRLARTRQAMVFQRPILLRRSVRANIDYALKQAGVEADLRRARLQQALEETGLSAQAEQPARLLSGGEQQKLALARAWALRPQILFLDEPCANLDPAATRAVETFVERIARLGIKVLMTTHDLGQARRIANEVLFIHGGRLLEKTPAQRFFEGPDSAQAAAFVEGRLLL